MHLSLSSRSCAVASSRASASPACAKVKKKPERPSFETRRHFEFGIKKISMPKLIPFVQSLSLSRVSKLTPPKQVPHPRASVTTRAVSEALVSGEFWF